MAKLFDILERQIEIYGGGGRPDDAIIRDILDYCLGYPTLCHHPKEDLVYRKLSVSSPMAALGRGRKRTKICGSRFNSPARYRDPAVAHDDARDRFSQCLVLTNWRYARIALHLRFAVLIAACLRGKLTFVEPYVG